MCSLGWGGAAPAAVAVWMRLGFRWGGGGAREEQERVPFTIVSYFQLCQANFYMERLYVVESGKQKDERIAGA